MTSELLYPKLVSFNRNSYHSWLIRPLKFLFYACLISTLSLYFSQRKEYFYRLILRRYFIVNSVPLRPRWVQFILAPSHPLKFSLATLSAALCALLNSDSHPVSSKHFLWRLRHNNDFLAEKLLIYYSATNIMLALVKWIYLICFCSVYSAQVSEYY